MFIKAQIADKINFAVLFYTKCKVKQKNKKIIANEIHLVYNIVDMNEGVISIF